MGKVRPAGQIRLVVDSCPARLVVFVYLEAQFGVKNVTVNYSLFIMCKNCTANEPKKIAHPWISWYC